CQIGHHAEAAFALLQIQKCLALGRDIVHHREHARLAVDGNALHRDYDCKLIPRAAHERELFIPDGLSVSKLVKKIGISATCLPESQLFRRPADALRRSVSGEGAPFFIDLDECAVRETSDADRRRASVKDRIEKTF